MEYGKIVEKVLVIKREAEAIRALPDLDPCFTACADSVLAHIGLMCNELGLDVDMPPQAPRADPRGEGSLLQRS